MIFIISIISISLLQISFAQVPLTKGSCPDFDSCIDENINVTDRAVKYYKLN
jgi:hypothetical protein